MQRLDRRETWAADLTAYLADVARRPLIYGEHDCALFAAGAVQAMTGVDLASRWRGRYHSLPDGARLLKADGIGSLAALFSGLLPEIAPANAMPGDVVLVDSPDGLAAGIMQGHLAYVLRDDALGTVSRLAVKHAFKVG